MSELKVDKITPRLGTTLTLGDTGDTINFGSGVLPNFENLTVTGDLTVDTNSLKVDSTNNYVGIGTASPNKPLHIETTGETVARIVGGTTSITGLYLGDSGNGSAGQVIYDNNGDYLRFNTSSTERVRITSAGNVGIGTNSPDSILHLYSNNSGGTPQSRSALIIEDTEGNGDSIQFLSTDTGFQSIFFGDASDNDVGRIAYSHSGDSMRFNTGGSEAMRIDSSGNVLVGKTSDAFADVGVVLSDSQANSFTRDGANVMSLRRNTSDGDIVSIYKDTTKVGSIGSFSSLPYLAGASDGILIGSGNVVPSTNTGAISNNSMDLGASNRQFKDGYFGGTITFADSHKLQNDAFDNLQILASSGEGMKLTTQSNSDVVFETNNNERMRVTGTGNVGIGTTSPATPFHLTSTSYPQYRITNAISFSMGVDSNNDLIFDPTSGSTRDIIFQNSGAGNIQVGIAKTNPSSALDVNGTVTATAFSGSGLGKVLQVVSVNASGWDYNTTMGDGEILHSGATITPSATSSKVLVIASFMTEKVKGTPGSLEGGSYYFVQINRGGTNIKEIGNAFGHYSPGNARQTLAASYVDSPSTTSATTYKLVADNVNGGSSARFIGYNPILTLVEIGA